MLRQFASFTPIMPQPLYQLKLNYSLPLISRRYVSITDPDTLSEQSNGLRERCNYAIILGGDNVDLFGNTELCNYEDAINIHGAMTTSNLFHPDNVSVLYGNGNSQKQFVVSQGISIYNYFFPRADEVPVSQANTFSITDDNSLKSLKKQFKQLSEKLKTGDKLIIRLSGHGEKYRGTMQYKTSLSPITLKRLIETLPSQVDILINVSSCYSGNFLSLGTLPNVVVTVSSPIYLTSFYHPTKISNERFYFTKYFFSNTQNNMLLAHAIGNDLEHNHHATDSFTYFLEKKLSFYLSFMTGLSLELRDTYHNSLKHFYRFPFAGPLLQAAELLTPIYDTSGVAFAYLIFKLAIRNFNAFIQPELTTKSGYLNFKVAQDISFVQQLQEKLGDFSVEHLSSETKNYLKSVHHDLAWVLARALELRKVNNYHYKTLVPKAIAFLAFALQEGDMKAIDAFIRQAKIAFDPLNKQDQNSREETKMRRYFKTFSLFSSSCNKSNNNDPIFHHFCNVHYKT